MKIEEFIENVGKLVFVEIGSKLYFPESGELYSPKTNHSKHYETLDKFLDAIVDGRKVRDIVRADDFKLLVEFNVKSKGSESLSTFTFGHAADGGDVFRSMRFPAEFNDGDRFQSLMKALDKFRARHAGSDHEFAITVDEDGYVHKYVEGGTSAVAIAGRDGQVVIHNHPNDSAFSDRDLLSAAQIQGERGIIASGTSGDYIFMKGPKFDAVGFAKAVRSAKMQGTDYNDAVDKWLTKNQERFGYTYEFRKAS